ncbi:hypothetical protein OROGR_004665 [Orobanche gracilis]
MELLRKRVFSIRPPFLRSHIAFCTGKYYATVSSPQTPCPLTAVVNTLERRLFYIPSFKIYGGVTGLYDYGPPGCALKANVLALWRQVNLSGGLSDGLLYHGLESNTIKHEWWIDRAGHFVLEENMLEVDCTCITPEIVLKASGHADKFSDLMVRDEKTGTCYRADHLLKVYFKDKLEKDPNLSAEEKAEQSRVLAVLDDLSMDELGTLIKKYGITAPDTRNTLSDPFPFNLMFQTLIGPSGSSPG